MSFLIWFALGAVVGLLVGWNLLPQPAMVKAWYDKAVSFVKEKLEK